MILLTAGSCAGNKSSFSGVESCDRQHMPLVLMVTGQLQPSGQSLVFFTPKGSEALTGKQMILPMLLLSRNPSLSFKSVIKMVDGHLSSSGDRI